MKYQIVIYQLLLQEINCQQHDSKCKYKHKNWHCVAIVDYSDAFKMEIGIRES